MKLLNYYLDIVLNPTIMIIAKIKEKNSPNSPHDIPVYQFHSMNSLNPCNYTCERVERVTGTLQSTSITNSSELPFQFKCKIGRITQTLQPIINYSNFNVLTPMQMLIVHKEARKWKEKMMKR